MRIKTKHFGELEYDEQAIINFPEGLLGFSDATHYILLSGGAPNDLFYWLQCTDDGNVAFALIDIYQVMPEYDPVVDPEMLEDLGDFSDKTLEIYNICVIPEEIKQIRVNLKAPIVINTSTRLGRQVVVSNEEYGIRHYIFNNDENEQENNSDGR